MAIDFEREREIDLGPLFPFESLGQGECLVSEAHKKKYALEQGQIIELNFNEPNLIEFTREASVHKTHHQHRWSLAVAEWHGGCRNTFEKKVQQEL